MNINIEINLSNSKWQQHIHTFEQNYIKKILIRIIDYIPNLKQVHLLELSILFTNDKEICQLNKKFRNKNTPTNVLSFPNRFDSNFVKNYMYLGDIAFGYETILKEAIQQNKSFENHLTHLLVHSILHLLGYTHDTDKNYTIMNTLEELILTSLEINFH